MALACEFIEDRGDAASDWALIGSSLGGYYATWLAERYGRRAALLNPPLPADDLAGYVGEHTMYHSSEPFEWRAEHLQELLDLRIERITQPERYFLLAATGDEVLTGAKCATTTPVHDSTSSRVAIMRLVSLRDMRTSWCCSASMGSSRLVCKRPQRWRPTTVIRDRV